MLAINL